MSRNVRNNYSSKAIGAGVLALGLVGAGVHFSGATGSGGSGGSDRVGLTAGETAVTVSCPDVAGAVGEVPAQAQAGVSTELANLERQITNVNARLAREPGQAQNQLNDIAGKRGAVIDRIILDITRVGGTAPAGLTALVDCSLGGAGDAGAGAGAGAGEETPPADDAGAEAPPAEGADDGGAADDGGGAAAGARTVDCPAVAGELPAVPAAAQDEVTRNLALLDKQISEADSRLAQLAVRPEGGPAFIQNAILGPLEDKRFSTLNRIATAIGRSADRPDDLQDLAPCALA
jgi:hypothetical protein